MARTTHFLGLDDEGYRYTVEIELRPHNREVEFDDHTRGVLDFTLSISGVIKDKKRHDTLGGQIVDHLKDITKPGPGWTKADIELLAEIWNEWHLNDMNSASKEQREAGITYQSDRNHVDSAGYKIGTKWLARKLPVEVLADVDRLQSLKATRRN